MLVVNHQHQDPDPRPSSHQQLCPQSVFIHQRTDCRFIDDQMAGRLDHDDVINTNNTSINHMTVGTNDPVSVNQRNQQKRRSKSVRSSDSMKRRIRHNFTPNQIRTLESSFDLVTHYPDFNSMQELSNKLKLPIERIQVWFQNRRAKFRRNSQMRNTSTVSMQTTPINYQTQ